MEVAAAEIELVLFPGPTPAGALRRFTERCGRQPVPEAAWFFGPWFQTGHANHPDPALEREMLETLLAADAPVSAAETHLRYLPCGEHAGHREAERERAAYFHGHGLAILSYLNPMLCLEYQPVFDAAARAAVLLRDPGGEPYRFWAYVGGREVPGAELAQFDFSAPGALEFFGRLVDELVEDGHDGWMEDFGEYTPPDAIAASGLEGSALHNQYPAAYHRALAQCAARHPRPLARFCRSGWSGSAADTPIVWGGDPTTGWGFDGLASAVIQGLSGGLSGIAIWGSDIGGFFTLSGEELTPELLIRWIQFGALSPVMRTKAGGVSIPPRPRPQIVDPEVLPHWRRWAKLHTQLNPYLMEAASEYAASGLPLMRHLALLEPWDPIAAGLEDQYLLGSDLLVAPVLSPGQRTRRLYLPAGRWCDLWRSAAYLESTGGLEPGRAVMLEGPGWVELPAPLEEIPVLVRAEARIPMLEPAIRSLYLAETLPLPGLLQIPNRPGEHLLWLRSGSAPEGPAARR